MVNVKRAVTPARSGAHRSRPGDHGNFGRRPRVFYGWYVLAASFIILFVNAGAQTIIGVMVKPLAAEFAFGVARGDPDKFGLRPYGSSTDSPAAAEVPSTDGPANAPPAATLHRDLALTEAMRP